MAERTDAVAAMDDDLPWGYRFAPSDQEVINLYLINLATQQPLPSQAVVERNIYESEPWKIFTDNDKWVSLKDEEKSKDKYIYVHTRFNYVSASSKKNMSRKAGKGSWSGKSKVKSITNDSGRVIGYMRSLTYKAESNEENRKSLTKKYGHWMMHEYTIAEETLPERFRPCNIVICKITKQKLESDDKVVSSQQVASEDAITFEDDANKREFSPREDCDHSNKRLKLGINGNHHSALQEVEWLQQLASASQTVNMPYNSYVYHPVMQEDLTASNSQFGGLFPSQCQPSIPPLAARPDAWLDGCFTNGVTNVGGFPYPIQSVPDQYIPTCQSLEENFSVGVASSSRLLPPNNFIHDGIGYDGANAEATDEGIANDKTLADVMSQIPTDLWGQNMDDYICHALGKGTYLEDVLGLTDLDSSLLHGSSAIAQSSKVLSSESIGGSGQRRHDLHIPVAVSDGRVDGASGNVISQLPVEGEGNNTDFPALRKRAKYGEEDSVLVDYASIFVSDGSSTTQVLGSRKYKGFPMTDAGVF